MIGREKIVQMLSGRKIHKRDIREINNHLIAQYLNTYWPGVKERSK